MITQLRKYGARGFALAALTAVAVASAPASAQHHGGGFHGGGGYHGSGYHGGHGWHGGGWGWGLGVGVGVGLGVGLYDPWWPGYYAGYPYYPYYADPPVTVVQQMPVAPVQAAPQVQQAPATWYYCDNPGGYYPYVQNCSVPWRPVAATTPPAGSAPQR